MTKHGLTTEEIFWLKVDKKSDDECWRWTGATLRGGYGNFHVNKKTVQAHRFSYKLHIGKIPEGMHVLHHCDNPPCVNPKHLFLGNNLINSQDKVKKNRQTKGEDHPHHKLKLEDIPKIRNMYSSGKYSMRALAKLFGICYSEMNAVINKRTWRCI
jgi:hypothetical protein